MNTKAFSKALSEVDDRYVCEAIEYSTKSRRPVWIKWAAAAACLCLALAATIYMTSIPKIQAPIENPGSKSETPTDHCLPSYFTVNGSTYMISSHLAVFDSLPQGFSFAGKAQIAGPEASSYYTNPDIPEWVYVYNEVATSGELDSTGTAIPAQPHYAYTRYVDVRLRGRDLLRCGEDLYISMWSVDVYGATPDVSREYHDAMDAKYGKRLEGATPDGFELVGTAEFSGYDTIPDGELSINKEAAEIYLSKDEPNIALVAAVWFSAPTESGGEEVRHDGFDVYIRYDCPLE